MQIYRAVVRSSQQISPGMTRITLGGAGLAGFSSTGAGDEYVRVFLPRPGETEPVLPVGTDSGWDYPEGVESAPMRTYTVRSVSPADSTGAVTVDIDFVVHDGGLAAAWAAGARPGDVVGINAPSGLYDAPEDLRWRVLLADATGLPAAARLIEQAPAGVRTRAVLEVADASHRIPIDCPPGTEITWVYGGNGQTRSRLDEILRDIDLPAGPGYVWCAGETAVLRRVRANLRRERGLPGTAYKVIGYWTDKAELWQERWDGLDPAVRAQLLALWDDPDRDGEEIIDDYEEQLALLGL